MGWINRIFQQTRPPQLGTPDRRGAACEASGRTSTREERYMSERSESKLHAANGEEPPHGFDEVPEEKDREKENRRSVAAATDKFAKYGAMRRDPKAEVVPVRKKLVNLPVRGSPNRDWF